MIHLTSVSKYYHGQPILKSINLRVGKGAKIGLVGANGAGKTTLLKILAKETSCDEGEVTCGKDIFIGLQKQETGSLDGSKRLLGFVTDGAKKIKLLSSKVDEILERLESSENNNKEALAHDLADAEEALAAAGGYALEGNARAILVGLGFSTDDFDKPLGSFSGGWRMRAMLGRLLVAAPDLLLLDEPTNHLDLESSVWLEKFLSGYKGSLVLISHDRYFLKRMVTSIVELNRGDLTQYPYSYDRYIVERARRIETVNASAERQAKEIARQEKFIERFRAKASKATAAQSRVKALAKIERIESIKDDSKMSFRFAQSGRIGAVPVELLGAVAGYKDKLVYEGLDFILRRGDRVALVGPNGAGKSTLIKILAETLPLIDGKLKFGGNVDRAFFAQHQLEALNPENSAIDEVTGSVPFNAIPKIRGAMGALGLGANDIDKKVKVLSGGEKSRVALTKVSLTPTNLLLLDEPTNHLDIKSRQALEEALSKYGGAIVFITHDRAFIDRVATKIVHVEDGRLTEYLGDYAYYEKKRKGGESTVGNSENSPVTTVSSGNKKESRRELAKRRGELSKLITPMKNKIGVIEKKIAKTEEVIEQIEATLSDPSTYEDKKMAKELSQNLAVARKEHDALLADWTDSAERLERITDDYSR